MRTQTEKAQWYQDAMWQLGLALRLRQERAHRVAQLTKDYGFTGPLVSGIEQSHWPEQDKQWLRGNASAISQAVQTSVTSWKLSGRRYITWRRTADGYHVDGSRY